MSRTKYDVLQETVFRTAPQRKTIIPGVITAGKTDNYCMLSGELALLFLPDRRKSAAHYIGDSLHCRNEKQRERQWKKSPDIAPLMKTGIFV
jgi:hypothetical protein